MPPASRDNNNNDNSDGRRWRKGTRERQRRGARERGGVGHPESAAGAPATTTHGRGTARRHRASTHKPDFRLEMHLGGEHQDTRGCHHVLGRDPPNEPGVDRRTAPRLGAKPPSTTVMVGSYELYRLFIGLDCKPQSWVIPNDASPNPQFPFTRCPQRRRREGAAGDEEEEEEDETMTMT